METIAIVTGGSSGIGHAISRRLGREGFNVAVAYRSNQSQALGVVAEIEELGGKAIALQADVSRRADVTRLFDRTQERFGAIDALVNNAGVSKVSSIADSDDSMIDTLVEVNLLGSFYGMQEATVRLDRGGSIVNISSTAVVAATPGLGVYLATKAAVEILTRVLAKEVGPKGIRVNAVAPGLVDSPMFRTGKTDQDVERFVTQAPMRRLGSFEEIADAVAYLLGPDASWVSGQILRANGGVA